LYNELLKAKVLSIGDEILIGQIVNTNASFISNKLISIGIPVDRIVSIGDAEDKLLDELEDSIKSFDVTIMTGGLGPTHDDITKPCLIKFFADKLVIDEKVLAHVKGIFASRKVKMPDTNVEQAMVPSKAITIWNPNGTAPGIWYEIDNKIIISLPGVPFEAIAMMEEFVIPELKKKFSEKINYVLKSKTLLTTGIGESFLSEMIGDINTIIMGSKLAFLPSVYGVRLRIDVKGNNVNEADKKIGEIETKLREKIGKYIFGENDELIEKTVGNLLREKGLTISVAESCTGGMISEKFTDISGSSDYLMGGVCTYSNDSKINILGVKKDTIDSYGAVSQQTAIEMAVSVRKLFSTDIGLSTTGIAGPTGGTDDKPVGLIWIGYADNTSSFAMKFLFGNNRERNRVRSSIMALEILRKKIMKIDNNIE